MITLVTGATGFIGRHLAEALVARGEHVRVLCRDRARLDESLATSPLVEIAIGDMRDRSSLQRAVAGTGRVVHLAAATSGSWDEFHNTTVLGTRAILEAAAEARVNSFLYVSSMSVYDFSKIPEGGTVTESAPLEAEPGLRNEYARAKTLAEVSALEHMRCGSFSMCVVRPGVVYGPGGTAPMLSTGFPLGRSIFLLVGGGRRQLPLVYVDNLVDVLLMLLGRDSAVGRVYNIVDPSPPSERDYFSALLRIQGRTAYFVPVPRWPFMVAAQALQKYKQLRRQRGAQDLVHGFQRVTRTVRFDTTVLQHELGWVPRVGFAEGMIAAFSGPANHCGLP